MKKNSYKLSNYTLIILAISLVSLLAGSFFFSKNPDSSYKRNMTENRIYNTLNMSVNDNDDFYSNYKEFNYAIKSYKLKYFDKNGNVVTDRGVIEAQKKKDALKEKGLDPKLYLDEGMIDQIGRAHV